MKDPKIGEIHIPLNSTLDMADVFDGRSMCLLDELSTFDSGSCAIVEGVIYVAKRGAYSTSSGWVCNYYHSSKVTKLTAESDKAAKNVRRKLNPKSTMNLPLLDTDDNLTDFEDGDFEGEVEYHWAGEETSDDDLSEDARSDEDELLLRRYDKFNITQDDRIEVKHALKNRIDNDKYYVCASSSANRLCIIWRRRESRKFWKEHTRAVGELPGVPGARTLYGSRTSKLGLYGIAECLQRARDWQEWHSDITHGWSSWVVFQSHPDKRAGSGLRGCCMGACSVWGA